MENQHPNEAPPRVGRFLLSPPTKKKEFIMITSFTLDKPSISTKKCWNPITNLLTFSTKDKELSQFTANQQKNQIIISLLQGTLTKSLIATIYSFRLTALVSCNV